jgi:hypothetical protein
VERFQNRANVKCDVKYLGDVREQPQTLGHPAEAL